MLIYTADCTVAPEGLSLRALFRLLQDAAGAQCVPLHLAGPDLEKMGLMWVIVRCRVQIARWPAPGESLRLHTWPGKARHGMMPRFYRLCGDAGAELRVSAVWAVVDRKTRSMVNGEDFGIHLDPSETGEEIRLPGAVKRLDTPNERDFTVPADYLDTNGHMNNTFYYAVAERCLGRDARQDAPGEILTEHQSEALCGETLHLRWGEENGLCYISGEHGDRPVFRMNLRYDPATVPAGLPDAFKEPGAKA